MSIFHQDSNCTVWLGDCLESLKQMPDESVQCCVTSPPYWGLRDYGVDGQIGQESSPEAFVWALVKVFKEVHRVLKKDGTLWLNLGDSYAAQRGGTPMPAETLAGGISGQGDKVAKRGRESAYLPHRNADSLGLKHKDLIGIPWRVAFALQSDGWYLRQDIIWSKPNPMPESVKDRCTKAHEYIFMLTKSAKYFYNSAAIRNAPSPELIKQVVGGYNGTATKDFASTGAQDASSTKSRIIEGMRKRIDKQRGHSRRHAGFNGRWDSMTKEEQSSLGSNKRSVWTIATKPFRGAHFATFPASLITPCIKAGSREGDTILDPFAGTGTTGMVALELGRKAILCELNPDYTKLIMQRCKLGDIKQEALI